MSPAAPPGTTIQFISDSSGNGITLTVHYNPVSDAFDVNPAVTVVSTFPNTVPLHIAGTDQVVHTVNVPTGTVNVSPAQLSANGVTLHAQVTSLNLAL